MHFRLISAICLLSSLTAFAQEPEQDSNLLSVPESMAMGIKSYSIGNADVPDGNLKLKMKSYGIDLPIGKYEVFGQTFIPQVAFEQTTFDLSTDGKQDVYSISLPMMFIHKQSDNWLRILKVTPSWHTDLDAKDEESYSLMGLMLWRYTDDSPHGYTIGAGINRLFGEYKPIPIASYSYQSSARTRYDLGFPVTKVEHRSHQDWSVFSSLAPVGGSWRYEDKNDDRINLSYTSWVASIGVRRHLANKFWLTLEAGQSFSRKVDFNSDTSIDSDADIDDANIIMLSIGLHP